MKTLKITWMAPIAVPNEVASKQKQSWSLRCICTPGLCYKDGILLIFDQRDSLHLLLHYITFAMICRSHKKEVQGPLNVQYTCLRLHHLHL